MQKITLTQKPVMTYDQWVIEHARRCLRVKIKRTIRRLRRFRKGFVKTFVKTWNRSIDRIINLADKTERICKRDLFVITGTIIFMLMGVSGVFVIIGMAGNTDLAVMGIRVENGKYSNGYISIKEEEPWICPEKFRTELKDGQKVSVTFHTNYTDDVLNDDTITDVQGWKLFN